ncbi:MAG: proline iminopeptidase-family hydrolase [Phycisphaerales bacterium]|nr:proline iminopeptidase-family hydrolase [Phycisphaerales bacterium]MCI0676267.1 proline iminopeptidase-family hydrolase [Phycisphaerales bacterium]
MLKKLAQFSLDRSTLVLLLLICGCAFRGQTPALEAYFDNSGREDAPSGGVRMVPVSTPGGAYRVWTKRTGNNDSIKVLLLHGGPGATHEYLEAFDSFFPGAAIEYYYYDQLGSFYSDQPDNPDLWELDRFVEEVEQVRRALGLDRDNFYLYGHSCGGLLAIEYALRYQQNLKGLIISNMMASCPAYDQYAKTVLAEQIDPAALSEIRALEAAEDYGNPRYMELLIPHHYERHFVRMPHEEWPEPITRTFRHLNPAIYITMQGPSELGISGKLENWDRTDRLGEIKVPTLVIGARYDTMDPAHMKWMARQFPRGRFLYCPNGSHCAIYDDQQFYMQGLIEFLRDVDAQD